MFRVLILGTVLLAVGLTACQQPEAIAPEATEAALVKQINFYSCVDQQAKAIVSHDFSTGTGLVYHTDLNNKVIARCDPQLAPESASDSEYSPDPDYSYVNNTVDEQVVAASTAKAAEDAEAEQKKEALDFQRIEAEDQQAFAAYYICLVNNVKILSKKSNELAQVIVQAAYPSCLDERNAAFAIMHTNRPYLDPGVMVDIDNRLEPILLLDVIKDRAPPAAP